MKVDISGTCAATLAAVKDAFAANFTQNGDVGASVAVVKDGELVVDLWGGHQDAARTQSVEARHDHQRVLHDEDDELPFAARAGEPRVWSMSDAPVEKYWPEFGQNGKGNVLVRHLLSHTAGSAGMGSAPRRHRSVRLGQSHRNARGAGHVVGAGLEVRLSRHHAGQPRRRSGAPRRWTFGRQVLRRGNRAAGGRRLPHRTRSPSTTRASRSSFLPRRFSSAAATAHARRTAIRFRTAPRIRG